MSRVLLSAAAVARTPGDAVIVALHAPGGVLQLATATPWWTYRQRDRVLRAMVALGANGDYGDLVVVPSHATVSAARIIGLGTGGVRLDERWDDQERLRNLIGVGVRSSGGRVVVAVPSHPDNLGSIVDGALLASAPTGRSDARAARPARPRVAVIGAGPAAEGMVRERTAVCDAVAVARGWVDAPSGDLGPADLLAAVQVGAADLPVHVSSITGDALLDAGLRAAHAVGRASSRTPVLIRLDYSPPGAVRHLCLVGKGVTFDSGGISIKHSSDLWQMKADMAGGAAVLAATLAIARLGLPLRVSALVPTADNMPGEDALRPGDVVRTYSGKTVEVLDTDAEGRLLLADALALGAEERPDLIVDLATLTGSQRIALGPNIAGVLGDDHAVRLVLEAARAAGESAWPMPFDDRLRPRLDSDVADIANVGGRQGGMLIAGSFLREFVPEGVAWAHVDMAGPAFHPDASRGYLATGATGFGVRTLVALAQTLVS